MEPQKSKGARDGSGRFLPGYTANPGGRPKGLVNLRELARTFTEEAIQTLAECLHDGDGRVRVAAANALLDRGWGKPVQPTEDQPEHDALAEMTDEELKRLVLES